MAIKSYQYEIKPELSIRLSNLKQYILSSKPGVCVERARYLTESYRQTTHLPGILRRAKATENILSKMTIFLMPGSSFAGNHASKPLWAPLFPEFDVEWLDQEIIHKTPFPLYQRPADRFQVDEETLPELAEIIRWWRGKNSHRAIGCCSAG